MFSLGKCKTHFQTPSETWPRLLLSWRGSIWVLFSQNSFILFAMLPRTEVLGWHGILLSPGEVSSAEIGHTADRAWSSASWLLGYLTWEFSRLVPLERTVHCAYEYMPRFRRRWPPVSDSRSVSSPRLSPLLCSIHISSLGDVCLLVMPRGPPGMKAISGGERWLILPLLPGHINAHASGLGSFLPQIFAEGLSHYCARCWRDAAGSKHRREPSAFAAFSVWRGRHLYKTATDNVICVFTGEEPGW